MTLGQNLKQTREEAGLSIEELSETTKIREKYLMYIEDDDFEKFSSPVYAKGMIKKYATACDKDPNEFLLQFYRENEDLLKHMKQGEYGQSEQSESYFVLTYRHIITFVIAIVVSLLLGYFYYNQHQLSDIPRIEVTSPMEFNSVTEDESILITGNIQNAEELYVGEERVVVDSTGYFEYNYTLVEGLNIINIKAVSHGGTEVDTARNVLKMDSGIPEEFSQ